jgi:hypothetical protein
MWNVSMSSSTRASAFVAAVVIALTLSLLFPSGAVTAGSTHSSSTPAAFEGATTNSASAISSAAAGVTPDTGGSPHPGQIIYQEVAPGGATSVDPSVAYDSISAEPILNVYQTLVAFNGSSTVSFLPELSMCVPGPGCAAMYGGASLVVNNVSTGSPQYWTFPIDPAARFYDPSTGANWPVYPSDVAFTFARTCGFADLPGFGAQPGWIECQALLPGGNSKWDGGIHVPFNNTPQGLFSSILINDTTYCPVAAMVNSNGCVTFDVTGGGSAWPFFLLLVADSSGGSVEPCGWFSAQAAAVPGFPGTTAASGDGPCLLPGGAHSTSDTSFQAWLTSILPTYWDAFELLALNTPGIQPGVRWDMVGSGPYYLTNQPFGQSVGYTLAQNPVYQAPTGCAGQPNCEPLPGPAHYMAHVTVVYRSTDSVGIDQYEAGQADFATILPGDTPQMLSLAQEGKIGVLTVPSLTIFLLAFSLTFSLTAAREIDPDPITVPGDFFSYVGVREFLVNAFPYTTVENTTFTTDGIPYGFNYGGAIPQHMGNYYPTNISWPTGDPVSNATTAGSAAWWWVQATTKGGPYYDPELANCTPSFPCQFPILGQMGNQQLGQMMPNYLASITSLTGGQLDPTTFACAFGNCCRSLGCSSTPGQSDTPMGNLGWAPDYPDPTDYVSPLYYPNSTYTAGAALYQTLAPLSCSQDPTPASSPGLLYWANQAGVPQACQGNAYAAMVWGMDQAAGMAVGPARVLMYNLVEHIANSLALYVYYDQQNEISTYASWIAKSSVNTNPMIGGEGDNLWYDVQYGPTVSSVTFTEMGLPSGTSWSVALNGTSNASTTSTLSFWEPNGRYPFSVGPVAGYATNQSAGAVTVDGGPANETITFTLGPSSSPAPSSSSGPPVDTVVAYVVVIAGVTMAVVLLRRRATAPPGPVPPLLPPRAGSPPAPP